MPSSRYRGSLSLLPLSDLLNETQEEKVEVPGTHVKSKVIDLNGPTTCNDSDNPDTLGRVVNQCNIKLNCNHYKVTTHNNNTQDDNSSSASCSQKKCDTKLPKNTLKAGTVILTTKKDIALCKAFVEESQNPIHGNDRKGKSFWRTFMLHSTSSLKKIMLPNHLNMCKSEVSSIALKSLHSEGCQDMDETVS